METKPGWKTSEFWLTAIAMTVSLAFASGLIPTDSAIDKLLGLISAALGGLGYSVSRGLAKKSSIIIVCVLGTGLMVGCATMETNAYRALATTSTTVDKAMLAWGDYVRAGKATSIDEDKVRDAYEIYQSAMRMAKASITTYQTTKDKPALEIALAQVESVGVEVVRVVRQFTEKDKTK